MNKIKSHSLTFDDVLLLPRHSNVLPRQVKTNTSLTKNIQLHIPLISAAMDTVTETEMAIAIAKEGGIGIIHKNLTIEKQVDMVKRVKRYESGMVRNPITMSANATIEEALDLMKRYSISGIPIVDGKKLIGIVTNRDLRIQMSFKQSVESIMTKNNLVTASPNVSLEEAEHILLSKKIEKLLIVDDKGNLTGLITFKDIEKKKKYPNATKDQLGRLRVGAAVGIRPNTLEHVEQLVASDVDVIAVDTAHGHSQFVLQMVEKIKNHFPALDVIAGNVATPEAVRDLILAGADCIKVGIGPGSICTTRVVAGVGVPQLSAIMNCYEEAIKQNIPIIGDGGIKYSGDIAKAIAAGASSVMIGSLFAGTTESPGATELYQGRKYKTYRGMGSLGAMAAGSSDRYFQDAEDEIKKFVPEGVEGRVAYTGDLGEIVYQLIGGLRASMGYCGAETILDFQKQTEFVTITASGIRESHPHDISITKESPNYSVR